MQTNKNANKKQMQINQRNAIIKKKNASKQIAYANKQ